LFDGFELLYLGLLARDDVPRELDYLLVLGVLEGDLGHRNSTLVVGDHRVYKALVGVFAVLHDHLPGHLARAHAHRAMVHVRVIHPGHPAGSAILLPTAAAPACSEDEGYRQEQRGQPPLHQKCLQDNPLFVWCSG
jgi:hypothetical protein